jgi:magnesium transporter
MLKRFELHNNSLVASESPDSPIIVYINPDAAEKTSLLNSFSIDEHSLSSALDPDEVSRLELTNDGMFLIWKRPMNYSGQDNFLFNVASVGLFLFKEKLIVVLSEDISLTPTGARRFPRLNSLFDVMLSFLYETIHHYLEHLKVIKMISREIQQKINRSMENKHLIQMFNLSESLVYYANAINGNNAVLTRLRSHSEKMQFEPRIIDLLDDIIIENNQCFKQAEIYSTVFSGLMDARGNLVNNNMNILLKNLTFINVVFLPLNLLASIGGMSEFSMMTQGVDWKIAYSLFIFAMVLVGWFTAFLLGRLDFGRNNRVQKRHILHRNKNKTL